MNKVFLLLISCFLLVSTSCGDNEKDKNKESLMDLGSDLDSQISDSLTILDKFNAWEHRNYYGIDISHYQGDVIKLMASTDSLHFVFAKATEGTGYIDPDFRTNWREIKEKGLIRGAYHFYRFSDSPIAQAEHFASQIQDLAYSDMAPVVDVEQGSLGQNVSIANMNSDLKQFLTHLEKLVGRQPIIYTNTSFSNRYLTNTSFSNYSLWLADYTKNKPRVPDLWKENGYLIWQKSQNYNDFSITTDFDEFNGRLNELLH